MAVDPRMGRRGRGGPGGRRIDERTRTFAIFMRHTDVAIPTRFDVHPDGRRIVVEALESFESDIGLMTTAGPP